MGVRRESGICCTCCAGLVPGLTHDGGHSLLSNGSTLTPSLPGREECRWHAGVTHPTRAEISSQFGFSRSINQTFFERRQHLSCAARSLADSKDSATSHQTSFFVLYFELNPGVAPRLCCSTRDAMSRVIPVQRVPSKLAIMQM